MADTPHSDPCAVTLKHPGRDSSARPVVGREPNCGRALPHPVDVSRHLLRTREGMKVAKAKGHLRGKQPKLNPGQEANLVTMVNRGEYSTAEIADLFCVAGPTVYRAVERERGGTLLGPVAKIPRVTPVAVGRAPRTPTGHATELHAPVAPDPAGRSVRFWRSAQHDLADHFARYLERQSLPGSVVEFLGDPVEISGAVHGQVGSTPAASSAAAAPAECAPRPQSDAPGPEA
jgi:hypothetical protein